MRVSVFGLGYVGCVTAASLAEMGHIVTGVDVSQEKVQAVGAGASPVGEPGLAELIADVVRDGHLRATSNVADAIARSEIALICVGTPSCRNGRLSVEAVERVARDIGQALRDRSDPFTVVMRSTVLPGTTEQMLGPRLGGDAGSVPGHIHLAMNPEFMREGSSLRDFARPPLTLVGCADPETAAIVRTLYAGVQAPFVHTTIRTAELLKYTANAFHALKVCFSNEMGDLCTAFGVDAQELIEIFLMDRKLNVSAAYLRPGFAFGGSCLPKDLRALLHAARGADLTVPLLSSLLAANDTQIRQAVDGILDTGKRRIGVVGLAFKPLTDDLRESPMVTLVETLSGRGCDVRVFDRSVRMARLVGANRRYIEEQIPHIALLMCDSVDELVKHADVLVIGNAGDDAAEVLEAADARHLVFDLTRGQARSARSVSIAEAPVLA